MNSITFSKTDKTIYWIATGFLTLLYYGSGMMYIFKTSMVAEGMPHLGFPEWLTYFLIPLKFAGISVVLFTPWKALKEWAYSAMFFNCVLAFLAHQLAGDSIASTMPAALGTFFVLVSYFYGKKLGKL